MPEPRDYAADPSCSSRCLYLPCYLSITSTPSDWRKSTRLSPSFLLGRAFSTWERGPASRPWNSSAAVSTLLRLRSPTRTMQRSASSRSRITMAGPSPWPMPASTSFSRRTCWSTLRILRACTPKSDACWRQAGAVSTFFRPTAGGFGPRWRLTSRRSRFLRLRYRGFFRKQRRAPPNCSDCGKRGTEPHGIRSASACPDDTVNAAMSSPSCGCFILVGGGGISATTVLPWSATSPWGCSIPGKCFLGCALGLPNVNVWRGPRQFLSPLPACAGTETVTVTCRVAQPKSLAICRAGWSVVS